MFCSKCGNKVEPSEKFCKACGNPNNEYQEIAAQETAVSAEIPAARSLPKPVSVNQQQNNPSPGNTSSRVDSNASIDKYVSFLRVKDSLHSLLGLVGNIIILIGIFLPFFGVSVSVSVFDYKEKVSASFWSCGGWGVFFLTLLSIALIAVRFSRVTLIPLFISTIVYIVKMIQVFNNSSSAELEQFSALGNVSTSLSLGFFILLIGFILSYLGIFLKKAPNLDLTKYTEKIEKATVDHLFKGFKR